MALSAKKRDAIREAHGRWERDCEQREQDYIFDLETELKLDVATVEREWDKYGGGI